MSYEYRILFTDPSWIQRHRRELEHQIALLPFFSKRPSPDEFWLRADTSHHWEFDLRIFLQTQGVGIEVAVNTDAFTRGIGTLMEWLSQRTEVALVDDDDVPVAWA
jgi:hypothetical protein